MRKQFIISFFIVSAGVTLSSIFYQPVLWSLVFFVPLYTVGLMDYFQKRHAVRRNFPVIGHGRYFLELIRPEIYQYFIESNADGRPFSREKRSIVYQRSKRALDTLPFGTQLDVYAVGYEWVNHSIMAKHADPNPRVMIGVDSARQPYSASVMNISAMSFGALSKNAILALNSGAKLGNFVHNTGEGGLSPYHLQPGGDITWQIGTGYFGCRNLDGSFSEDLFKKNASYSQVKMIEIKLSQGAKPGHGGILPAKKLTPEIAKIRNVPLGRDVISPPSHSAFKTPIELLKFIEKLRTISSKPVGMKLCLGKRREFLAICKAMVLTGLRPDFITVDGAEGGTGAAPLEFSNSVGFPLREAIIFVHNALVGFGLRKKITVIASGKIITGFDILTKIAIGADIVNSARGMMMALGCIQALRCNSNHCPVGVATQDPNLVAGLDVTNKQVRVANFQKETLKTFAEILGAMGLSHPNDLRPWHLMRRVGPTEIKHYGEIYQYLNEGDLLKEPYPKSFDRAVKAADPNTFDTFGT